MRGLYLRWRYENRPLEVVYEEVALMLVYKRRVIDLAFLPASHSTELVSFRGQKREGKLLLLACKVFDHC